MGTGKIEVVCPCCETKLKVDKKTGEVIWEEKKQKAMPSLADMVKDHDAHKKEQESLFKKRSEVQKERLSGCDCIVHGIARFNCQCF